MHEFDCLNCGKHNIMASRGAAPKFCDRTCWREYNQKKVAAAEAAKAEQQKENKKLRYAIVPQKQCRKCKYGLEVGGYISCDYVFQTNISRVVKHLNTGMPTKCEEFKERARARRKKAGAGNG